jgi:antitoxin (DNA-binding transcriptional repressor) of toxin-antitoxin stability system
VAIVVIETLSFGSLRIAYSRSSLLLLCPDMARQVIHISELEAASNFAALLARVRAGVEVVIEHDSQPVAVVHPAELVRRTISECIALLPEDSTATIDADFAKDVEAAVESHREALDSSAWE